MAIKKSKNGTWYFNEYLGVEPISDKDVIITRRGFDTKEEAQKELTKLKYEFDMGLYKKDKGITFQEVYDIWIELYKNTVKESTLNNALQIFRDHILPFFGKLKITDINTYHCQQFANQIMTSFKFGKMIFNNAKRIYSYAKDTLNLVQGNDPFDGVILPKFEQKKDKGSVSICFLKKKS